MNNCDAAIDYVIKSEGNLEDNLLDKGGITKYGISLKLLQSINYHVNNDGVIDKQDVIDLTIPQAREIYKDIFWLPEYEKVSNTRLITYIFDSAVNESNKQAHKFFQRATWAFTQKLNYIEDDGIFGDLSIRAANSYGIMLLPAMRAERAGYYRSIVNKDLSQAIFINGWLNRTYAL